MQRKTMYAVFLGLAVVLFASGRAEAKFTVGGGFLYMFQNGSENINLDPGPGVHGNLGFQGKIFGVRGDFFYAAMQKEHVYYAPEGKNADIFGGTVDFKVRPIGMIDFPVQPYGIIGVGGMKGDGVGGGLGNLGLGLEVALGEHFSIGAEGAWKPLLYPGDDFFENQYPYNGDDDNWDTTNFFTASIDAAFHF